MEDSVIIELLISRSERGLEELSKKYGKECRKMARTILADERDSEECINDAFLAVWNTVPPQLPVSLPAYLCGIVKYQSIIKYRSNTAKKRNKYSCISIEEMPESIRGKYYVEEQLDTELLMESIGAYLETADIIDRKMFVQRYFLGYEIDDISETVSKSKNYVNVHLHRIKVRLKKYLQGNRII